MKPKRVMSIAVIFRWVGIVICGIVIGVILFEMRNLTKMLRTRRCLIGFIKSGLFSLINISAGKRGCPIRAK